MRTQAQQHLGRVERVGEQLKELYGPLLACVTASKSAYDAMVRQVGGAAANGSSFRAAVRADEASPEGVAYRAWVEEVLLPLSDRAATGWKTGRGTSSSPASRLLTPCPTVLPARGGLHLF